MLKPEPPFPGPAGLAEWLPLLGSICQVLAGLGEAAAEDESDAVTARGLQTGEDRG